MFQLYDSKGVFVGLTDDQIDQLAVHQQLAYEEVRVAAEQLDFANVAADAARVDLEKAVKILFDAEAVAATINSRWTRLDETRASFKTPVKRPVERGPDLFALQEVVSESRIALEVAKSKLAKARERSAVAIKAWQISFGVETPAELLRRYVEDQNRQRAARVKSS